MTYFSDSSRARGWVGACFGALLLAGCGVATSGGDGYGSGVGSGDPASGTPNSNGSPEAGTLTAGAWDDNRNYDFYSTYLSAHTSLEGAPALTQEERDASHTAFAGPQPAKTSLDVVFVVDNTGSMGDEIAYLKSEFDAISSNVEARFPGTPIRYATVAYRDYHDDFVVRAHEFRDNPMVVKADIDTMSADGGDDYPEAAASALEATNQLGWQADARLVFWIADAPSHLNEGDRVANAIRTARDKHIHIYPVAASGVDDLAEYSMRAAAQLTGGRYVFLTNDSGVGDTHKEPEIPCYFVTKLDVAVERMIGIELSGEYREPVADQIIRTGGDPHEGACKLGSGQSVAVF